MLRRVPILVALALTLSAAPAGAATPSATTKVLECESALAQASRVYVVEGRMRTLSGARALQMRFALQTRLPGRTRWTRVAAPGFGEWETATPAPRRYRFDKRVVGLDAPAVYRMVVRFRWLGSGGRVLASERRTSSACAQPDLRPDLEAESITVTPGDSPDTARYRVPVHNAGPTVAGPFAVGLAVDGRALRPITVITGLGPGGRSELVFEGPACRPGARLVAGVDPDAAVDERDEEDSELVRTCPA